MRGGTTARALDPPRPEQTPAGNAALVMLSLWTRSIRDDVAQVVPDVMAGLLVTESLARRRNTPGHITRDPIVAIKNRLLRAFMGVCGFEILAFMGQGR